LALDPFLDEHPRETKSGKKRWKQRGGRMAKKKTGAQHLERYGDPTDLRSSHGGNKDARNARQDRESRKEGI